MTRLLDTIVLYRRPDGRWTVAPWVFAVSAFLWGLVIGWGLAQLG